MMLWAQSSDAKGERVWHVALPSLVAAAGFGVASLSQFYWVVLLALTVATVGINAFYAPFYSMPSLFLSGGRHGPHLRRRLVGRVSRTVHYRRAERTFRWVFCGDGGACAWVDEVGTYRACSRARDGARRFAHSATNVVTSPHGILRMPEGPLWGWSLQPVDATQA
jgi:hypothetical protein